MAFTTSGRFTQEVQTFEKLSVDERLALLWVIYTEMGGAITPAAPGASTVSPAIADGLYDQVKEKSHDEQLQIQRDLVSKTNSLISREYGSMSDTTKLLFWYRLAQGMDEGVVVPYPQDYTISTDANVLFEKIKSLDFNEQITLLRDWVAPMGTDAVGTGL